MESDAKRRNRLITGIAGAITVIAIVIGFAGDYLGLPWKGLRPAAELLLLAELVVLVVIERHQLFEPVHEAVGEMRSELRQLSQHFELTGQTTFFPNPAQTVKGVTRALREALEREQKAPQILRYARLAGQPTALTDPELGTEFREMANASIAFELQQNSAPDSKVRSWSMRVVLTVTGVENFEYWRDQIMPYYLKQKPLNLELKVRMRVGGSSEGQLTPNIVTDRDVVVCLDDDKASHRCGFLFHGDQFVAVFARWFDELWTSIPNEYLVYSRAGLNETALNRIRQQLVNAESAQERLTA
jgi:hypothetical protein